MHTVSIIGLGWLGKPLGHLLQQKGYRVIGSSTRTEKVLQLQKEGLEALHFSLSPEPEGSDFLRLFQSKTVVVTLPPRSKNAGGQEYIARLKQLRALLDASQVEEVVFISSTGIYPEKGKGEGYGEETALHPDNVGNPILLLAEQVMDVDRSYACTVLRLGGLMGSDRVPGMYFSGKEQVLGHTAVNFIHQRDAARLVAWVIEKKLWNQTFNGVAPLHPLRRELYEKNAKDLGIAPPASYQQVSGGKEETSRLIHVDKILETGFPFDFPDPLAFTYST